MRRESRLLQHDRRVDVFDAVSLTAHFGTAVAQQFHGVRIAPSLVRVGEMPAEIAKGGGPEQRVAERVRQSIGVGMSERAAFEWNLDAAEDQFASFHQAVRVEAVPYAHAPPCSRSVIAACARSRSSASVTLKFSADEATMWTLTPMRSSSIASSVASTPSRKPSSCARSISARVANCGVCAAQSTLRSSVYFTTRCPSPTFMVSTIGTARSDP